MQVIFAASVIEPETNERGSSLISRRLHCRACNHFFSLKQGIVVMREWEDLGCAAYQSHV